ncbi:hypothetical protein CTheo_9021 [Ceratobasidium theobromae]|uniref:Uncharacterized protein n=1 Tax=Ceratobasidium theobromae TaxID=1582974 RepID=A0A5N5Q6R6_9AGAM|nr:hypothetical protein CTheo_9021 [Ceratobasidium theobromae]
MPSKQRLRKSAKRKPNTSLSNTWQCPLCHRLFATYKGAPQRHLRSCTTRTENERLEQATTSDVRLPTHTERRQREMQSSSDSDNEASDGEHEFPSTMLYEPDPTLNLPVDVAMHSEGSTEAQSITGGAGLDGEFDIPQLAEGEVWIRRHPSSSLESGYFTPADAPSTQHTSESRPSLLPPHFPFRTQVDYLQAEIFSKFNASDKQIDSQLKFLHETGAYQTPKGPKLTLRSAADYHEVLSRASGTSEKFVAQSIVTQFKGLDYHHMVHTQPLWPLLVDIVRDSDFKDNFAYYPEQRYICCSEHDKTPIMVWEELHHGLDWWNLQSSLPANQHVLFLVVYVDETNVTLIGGVKVWPVYVWVGNLPAATRKQHNKKGGAILVGYLPEL